VVVGKNIKSVMGHEEKKKARVQISLERNLFEEEKVRVTGRGAIGVAGIEVEDDKDEVIGMICVNKEDTTRTILVVSEKGFGKRTQIDEYRITNRGGKGVKTINVTDKTGSLVGILYVTEKEDLIITCKSGITIRTSISEIREAGRATQGVKLIRIDEGDEIAAISQIEDDEEEDEGGRRFGGSAGLRRPRGGLQRDLPRRGRDRQARRAAPLLRPVLAQEQG